MANDDKTVTSPVFNDSDPRRSSTLARVRKIVLEFGWNSTSYQVINPGIGHWFGKTAESVVGFVTCNGVRVVAGAPICVKEVLGETAEEFERDAAQENERVCYVFAEGRLESLCSGSAQYSRVLLGAQPVWNPANWAAIVKGHKSLRELLRRPVAKGASVAEWSCEKATDNPLLIDCLHEWLGTRGLPPLHFLVEPETLEYLFDRRIFVAEWAGDVMGFVVLSPIARRNGWLFEQFVHHPNAPNGTVELMIDSAMCALAKDGYDYATLGLAPLSTRADVPPFENPLWLKIFLGGLRKHAQRFYNFDGLDAFKAKFQPERWEPIFAISNEPRFSFRTLYAIASAFSGNAPIRMFAGGVLRALGTEIDWLRKRVEGKLAGKVR